MLCYGYLILEICYKHDAHLQVPFSKVLYIESSDFRLKDSKDYYGLAPGKTVLLRCQLICDQLVELIA